MIIDDILSRSSGRKTGEESGHLCNDTKTRKVEKYRMVIITILVPKKLSSFDPGANGVPAVLSRGGNSTLQSRP